MLNKKTAPSTRFFKFMGKEVQTCKDGYLKDPSSWNEKMAVKLAKLKGINRLKSDH
ncbi:TusE/DsrC/DsvC family sulfur relay protein [Patescibacteria group bacterium]|nr:TusE/DsrC/DsvC family sulfur relay protein [Patescibacteria group bacterium]